MVEKSTPPQDTFSPALTHIIDQLSRILPEDLQTKLDGYRQKIVGISGHHDLHRCYRCAQWAVDLKATSQKGSTKSILSRLGQVLHEANQARWATEFGLFVSFHPVTDLEVGWIDDALGVAQELADEVGWDQVPWEQLLDELIELKPAKSFDDD